uniref:Uncharacterized protein n=1 Tax=Panagrolaimus davidi TaxID=227884 RepID=A0A914QTT7_9BILA
MIDLICYRIIDDMIFKVNGISPKYQDILYMIADVFYIAQQILDVIFLFIVSEPFRTSILNFYTFGTYLPKKASVIHATNIVSIRHPLTSVE